MSTTEAAVRRTGALVALAAASGLVLFPTVVGSNRAMLALHAIFLIGCAAVLLSPAHRVVPELARRAAETTREFFRAPFRAAAEPVPLLEKNSCVSASSPVGTRASATWQTEAAVRRTGALVSLAAASVLLLLLVPGAVASKHWVLPLYAVLLLGCSGVLLFPAHRTVADLARQCPQINTVLRWAAFTCIVFCAASDVRAVEKINGLLFLFLLFTGGVWTVTLSMLAPQLPAAEEAGRARRRLDPLRTEFVFFLRFFLPAISQVHSPRDR